ncbi:MAG: hypothetical protein JNM51_17805, partial [Bacteroidia bacterium]|nr:hypothetical protein [Bacteroidia bacterium]
MKNIITAVLVSLTAISFSQSNQVQNASNYLRNKEFDKAKASADAAAVHESTMNNPKLWKYRGQIYQEIYFSKEPAIKNLDAEAEEKALESYINCFKNDKDKFYSTEEGGVKGLIVQATAAVSNKANAYKINKEFDKALYCYELLEQALPFDFDQGMKRANITKEKLMYNKFETYRVAANKNKMVEYAEKLINIKYKEPKIYTDMVKICMVDRDTVKALEYIGKGKLMFE